MFDVNSLGGKLIDNQNLKKALENGGGSSGGAGYEKEETKVSLVDEQTITVTNTAEEGQDPYYTVSEYTNNEEVLNGLEIGTEGTCVIDGTEYKAVWSQEYVGYVRKYIAVYDGETEILQLGLGGGITNNGFFTAEGTHTISVYYMKTVITPSEDFKTAVSKVSNMRYIGYGSNIRINETTDSVIAGGAFYGSVDLTANYVVYDLTDGTTATGDTMNFDEVNYIKIVGCNGLVGFFPQETYLAPVGGESLTEFPFTAWNLSGNAVTAEDLNNNLALEIELYKIEG